MKNNVLCIVSVLLLLIETQSRAEGLSEEQNNITESEQQDIDDVVLILGERENLIGVAQSASQGVVSREEIQQRPMSRTGEILEFVPGMVVTQHSGTGKANQYFLRGFNLDHGTDFATSIDGMPINLRTHGHGQGYTDLNFIIDKSVDSISYKKGAYYADVGDFSGAGAAEIKTVNQVNHGVAEFTVGENAYYNFTILDGFDNVEDSWIYAVNINTRDGPWTDINEDLNKTSVLLKNSREVGGGIFEVTAMLYDNSWNSADQIPQRAVQAGIIDELGSIDTSVGGESNRYSLSLNWQNDNYLASLYAIQYDLNLWSNFTYFLDAEIDGDQFQQVDSRSVYGGRIVRDFSREQNGLAIKNKVGIEARYDDIGEVGLHRSINRIRNGTVRSDKVEELSVASFFENSISWTENLKTIVGFRYDYYQFDVSSLVNTNTYGVDVSQNGGTTDDGIFSTKASLVYALSDEWESYWSMGQGFHSNDARGTTIKVDPVSGQPVEKVDPLVRSFGYELGVRGFWNEQLNTSVALWNLELDSELLFVGDAGNTEPAGASKRKGIEITAYYRLTKDWAFDLEYAYTDAEFVNTSEGRFVPGAVKEVIQAGVNANFTNGWFGSARLRYFGERPLDEAGSVFSDSTSLVNLRLGYRFDHWVITTDILNALDSNDHDIDYFYASRLNSEPTGAEIDDLHYHVLEPRTLRVSVTYNF
ncbi:TonB-dependent receptor [Kangiella koreensis]|uniref:TonB-dependent receptor plug n=1 Tax=Kangiella koreensis (strain DSM 16069 / JCM 12317 / KCTC 12182 / SW-125) TaxID=523791 RepID=C7R5V6_KANKD|nr:TonB-dependent receptor [Kangiella koreensis]ACV27280.1 TonB-dependent receptor plug [Kangiella koreensis DSM 16069]